MIKLFSKYIALSLASAITLCSLTSVVSAKEVPISSKVSTNEYSAQDTLTQFLSAYNKKDIELSASLSNDDRYENIIEEKNALSEYFKDPTQTLSEFEVLETISEESEFALVKSRLTLQSGEITERVFEIKKMDGKWIVMLSDTIPNKEHFKQIKQSNEKNPGKKSFKNEDISNFNSTSSDAYAPTTRARITNWNYTFNYDSALNHKYSSAINVTSKVGLNYRQYGGSGTPEFVYSIVKKGGINGDTTYASHTWKGSNSSASRQAYLNCGARTGVYLKVSWKGPYSTNPSVNTTTFGELYSQ